MDNRQLERIYDAHASGLFHYLLSFTADQADARDLLQEIFTRLASEGSSLLRSEKAFVYRIAHNLAISWLRRRNARRDAHALLLEQLGGHEQPPGDLDRTVLADALAAALRTLPAEQRTVAQLKLWDGFTLEEIAAAQGIPLNTAASRWRYAITKLRLMLQPLYEELQ